MSPAPVRPDDGRLLRSKRSREAMVDATLELVFEGRVPTSADIAERAGVTQRTLFNQFGDMDTLIEAVGRRQGERIRSLDPDLDPSLPFAERVERFTAAMAVILEESMHIRWAILQSRQPRALEMVQRARTVFRRMVVTTFAPELETAVAPRRAEIVDELEIAVDPITWRVRRTVQGLEVEDARVRMADTVVAILRAAAPA